MPQKDANPAAVLQDRRSGLGRVAGQALFHNQASTSAARGGRASSRRGRVGAVAAAGPNGMESGCFPRPVGRAAADPAGVGLAARVPAPTLLRLSYYPFPLSLSLCSPPHPSQPGPGNLHPLARLPGGWAAQRGRSHGGRHDAPRPPGGPGPRAPQESGIARGPEGTGGACT